MAADAIFLDFDGVLAESVDIKTEAFRALYAPYGEDVVEAVIAHHHAHAGISRVEKIRHCHARLLGIDLDGDALAALAARFAALVEDKVVQAPAVPGARDFLERHRDHPLFVVSGTPEAELRRIVARRGLEAYFVAVCGSPRRKPEILRALIGANGWEAARTVMVGDGTTDRDAARAVGAGFVGRVPAGAANPFPAGTRVVTDLSSLRL